VGTIWCFTDRLGYTHTRIYTATFEILALVQHEKEGIRLASTLGTLQHILDQLVGSLYLMIILYELQGKDHGLDIQ
jgi:hypothetical protein